MMQGELFSSAIVRDPVRIKFYLAQCLAVLRGEGVALLNAARPHTGAWYWRKTAWNEYTLVGGRETYKFSGYPMLHKFCVANSIDAIQA